MTPLVDSDLRALRLLRSGPFRLMQGGWRFGSARIGNGVVERLVASGQATRDGDKVSLQPAAALWSDGSSFT